MTRYFRADYLDAVFLRSSRNRVYRAATVFPQRRDKSYRVSFHESYANAGGAGYTAIVNAREITAEEYRQVAKTKADARPDDAKRRRLLRLVQAAGYEQKWTAEQAGKMLANPDRFAPGWKDPIAGAIGYQQRAARAYRRMLAKLRELDRFEAANGGAA